MKSGWDPFPFYRLIKKGSSSTNKNKATTPREELELEYLEGTEALPNET